MKVIEDVEDRNGEYPIWFKNASLGQIHEYLHRHYGGYMFVIVLDETKDEYEPLENPLPVYFADAVLNEIADYAGKKVVT